MSLTGIILMLAASISMAISNVFMRYVRGTFQPIEITRTIAIGGFVLFNIIVWIRAAIKGDVHSLLDPVTHPQFLISIAFLGIFCILLSASIHGIYAGPYGDRAVHYLRECLYGDLDPGWCHPSGRTADDPSHRLCSADPCRSYRTRFTSCSMHKTQAKNWGISCFTTQHRQINAL